MTEEKGSVLIYQSEDGSVALDVTLERDTVWLSQAQMCDLFGRDQSVISRHIRNVFREGELGEQSNMQKMHTAGSDKPVSYFSLDVIISVGYRVKSQQGTRFRIWATSVLRDYLVKGYALNEQRLQAQGQQLAELKQTLQLMGRVIAEKELSGDEAQGMLAVIADYVHGLSLLDDFDHDRLQVRATTRADQPAIGLAQARQAIAELKPRLLGPNASTLFGQEKDQGLESALNGIYQTFGGEQLLPSVEEKAANLLYRVIKNHPFSDGNKRIGAFLFIWFLDKHSLLYRDDGSQRLAQNALVALALLIAQSQPSEKDLIIRLVINLINRDMD